jgi:DNA polymerase
MQSFPPRIEKLTKMTICHIDYETTSACDITLGAYRYACDPSTRILMFAIAKDDGEPVLWDSLAPNTQESQAALALLKQAIGSGVPIYAHNAQFELAISTYRMRPDLGIDPPHIDQWRCTLAMCRRAAAPESLAESAKFFGLNAPKDSRGKALIGVFSDQSKAVVLTAPETGYKITTNTPVDELERRGDWIVQLKGAGVSMTLKNAWELFKEYCRQDVRVEQELHRKINHFDLRGDVLESFQFDLRMNWRGVPVNVPALKNADGLVNRLKEKLGAKFYAMTGLNASQGKAVLAWLKERGYPEANLTAATVQKVICSPPPTMTPLAIKALKLRSLMGFAALSKIPTMANAACTDGRVRGAIQWHAARTGRAGGRIIQPQNFKKSTVGDETHLCYRMICEGWEDEWFEELWESPLETIASSIRHFIQPKTGGFYDLDYVGVESVGGPWACGQFDKLDSILRGECQYKVMASKIAFKCAYDEVTKEQRQVGKVLELQCIYGTGGKGMRKSLASMGVKRTLKECNTYVKDFRATFSKYPEAWQELEDAAKFVIANPGKTATACNERIVLACGNAGGVPYLTIRLPSGRRLYYPRPMVKPVFRYYDEEDMLEDPWKREEKGYWIDSISFYGKIPPTSKWGRVHTWGSRLFENITQALCVDLLNRGCIESEARGFPICMIIHDQVLCETSASSGTLEDFTEAFCTKDEWTDGLPLKASGDIAPYYLKEQ